MNRKIKLILSILILLLAFLILRSTYSKYVTEKEAAVVEQIAGWIIKINDTDITAVDTETGNTTNTTNTTSSSTVEKSTVFYIEGDDIVFSESSRTSDGKIAPGAKGYFYLRIDPTGTQTAIKYTITLDKSEIDSENHINFSITDISVENDKEIHSSLSTSKDIIQRIKSLSEVESEDDATRIDTIKISFEWAESEDTDEYDTELGETASAKISIPIIFNAIQYVGGDYDI